MSKRHLVAMKARWPVSTHHSRLYQRRLRPAVKGEDMLHLLRDAPPIVYTDVKSPYAFISKPTLALEAELGLQFDFRLLTLDMSYLAQPKRKSGCSRRSSGTWKIVRYAYRDARRYAERQGYMLKGTEKSRILPLPISAFYGPASRRGFAAGLSQCGVSGFLAARIDIENVVARKLPARGGH